MIKFKPVQQKRPPGRPRKDQEAPKPTLVVKQPRPSGRRPGLGKVPGSGRKKGSVDKKTLARELSLQDAMNEVFGTLTDADIDAITPLQVMQLCTRAAVRAGNFHLARDSARDWAPYVHSKMASVAPDDDPNKAIIIKGGLPDPSKPPEGGDDDAGN